MKTFAQKYGNILVTGGAGFIGSHLVDSLVEQGLVVYIVDNYSLRGKSGQKNYLNSNAVYIDDDFQSDTILSRVAKGEFSHVVHLAAQKSVSSSVKNPVEDVYENVLGTVMLIEACKKGGVQHLIFASSGGAIYGETSLYGACEWSYPRPESPYALSKLTAEKYIDLLVNGNSMKKTFLRFANVYGPRQEPDGEAGVVAIFTKQMIAGKQSTLYGNCSRDYLYVADAVRAIEGAMEGAITSQCVNVGTGVSTNTKEIWYLIAEHFDSPPEYANSAHRLGDVRFSVLQCTEFWRLGSCVGIEEGIKKTVDWFKSQK